MALNSAILHRVELFAGLEPPALDEIVRHGRTRRLARGTVVFRQGEKATSFHVLVSGRIRIDRSAEDAGNLVIRYVGPGEMFGALALFHGGGYPADAWAITDCVEIRWPAAALIALIERYPRIALNVLRIVGRRLDELQVRLHELTVERVEQRLAHALIRLAKQAGKTVEHGIEISFPLSRKDLAAMTASRHYTVSRILAEWQDRGLIAGGRKKITVRDLPALEAVARASIGRPA
jgi:CRP-like cAMP-binding protein